MTRRTALMLQIVTSDPRPSRAGTVAGVARLIANGELRQLTYEPHIDLTDTIKLNTALN